MKILLPSINLLRGREKGFFDNFLGWALTIGRVLVILTETIALSAFIYRFSLDRQLIDLHDVIGQKQAIVKLLKNNEEKYRNLQERLTTIATLTQEASKTTKVFTDIVSLAPKDVAFNVLAFSQDSVKIDANASSITSLTSFIKSLRVYPHLAAVSIDKVENKTASATIAVSITVTLKQ